MSNNQWFVFYTHARGEKAAGEAIIDLGFPAFIPWEKLIRCLPNGKPKRIESPLFPRYGFVQFDPNANIWPKILQVKEIIGLLGASTPIPVSSL